MKIGIGWSIGLVGAAVLALTTGCNDSKLTAAAVAGEKPTAVITGSQAYGPLDTAAFSGASSTAVSPKTITAYDWSISARPSGSTSLVQTVGSDNSQAEFFVDLAGDYKIKLKVTDSEGLSDETEYAFSAIPSQSLHIELTWPAEYTQADMDLHLINKSNGGAFWDSTKDCYFTNCKPDFSVLDWGSASSTNDNPTLDIDNITETVPENINIKTPADGVYEVNVHYYATHGAGVVHCHVRIYVAGAVAWEGDQIVSAPHDVWNVADINWSAGQGTVTPVGTIFPSTH